MEQNITKESVKNVFKFGETHKYMDSRSSVKQNKRNTKKITTVHLGQIVKF